jgi:hypothetical protein
MELFLKPGIEYLILNKKTGKGDDYNVSQRKIELGKVTR